jgi:hypothetical protein
VSWLVQAAPLAIRASGVIARIEEGEARRAVEVHIRRAFERAVPFSVIDENGEAELVSTGRPTSVRFVTRSDGRLEGGGLIVAELRREETEGSLALVTERRPLRRFGSQRSEAETIVLVDPVESIGFRYFGRIAVGAEAGWTTEWTEAAVLPRLVEITVRGAKRDRMQAETILVALPAAAPLASERLGGSRSMQEPEAFDPARTPPE